jgi:hypothetical protein
VSSFLTLFIFMKFELSLTTQNLVTTMRGVGYAPEGSNPSGEQRFVKPLAGARYPRFHIYCTEQNQKAVCNLHLDQKQPSYQGSSAHSGEYDGSVVEREAQRILLGS